MMDFDLLNFDMPIFKVLARNDTGEARGHQGGMVIPRAIEQFFPRLALEVTPENPTVEKIIWAELYLGAVCLASVSTRYQLQTWGGTRSPEYRLTNGLSVLRNEARENDALVIQRSVVDSSYYRLTLVKQGTALFDRVSQSFQGRRWGPLYLDELPLTESAAVVELQRQEAILDRPFSMFEIAPQMIERRTISISRSRAFSTLVTASYQNSCAVCGYALTLPNGRSEIEAGHIVPRSRAGADDVRNGIALCRSHHWAFDAGLFAVNNERAIHVAAQARYIPSNAHLIQYHGQQIGAPSRRERLPSVEAFNWHFENVLLGN
jgi:putative restriction endonuclease